MEKIQQKVKEFEEWCNFEEDSMNDHIRDFFADTLDKGELFEIINLIKTPTITQDNK